MRMAHARTSVGRSKAATSCADARGDESARAWGATVTRTADVLCGGEWPYMPKGERAAETAEYAGTDYPGKTVRPCPGGQQWRGRGFGGARFSAIAGTGRPAATTKSTNTSRPGPQHVLKAEAARPDATDRGSPATPSPVGGPMGCRVSRRRGARFDQRSELRYRRPDSPRQGENDQWRLKAGRWPQTARSVRTKSKHNAGVAPGSLHPCLPARAQHPPGTSSLASGFARGLVARAFFFASAFDHGAHTFGEPTPNCTQLFRASIRGAPPQMKACR